MKDVDILVIVNTRAGIRRGIFHSRLFQKIMKQFRHWNQRLSVEILMDPDLNATFNEYSPKLVAIWGGDGTTHQVIHQLLKLRNPADMPIFLPLPGGTMNCLARDTGWNRRTVEKLRTTLETLAFGRTLNISRKGLLRCEVSPGSIVHHGLIYAQGLPFAGLQAYARRGASVKSCLLVILKIIVSPRYRRTLLDDEVTDARWDAQSQKAKFLGFVCSTVNTVSLGMKPFFARLEDPRHFQFLATTMSVRELLPHLHTVFRGIGGRRLDTRRYINLPVTDVRLSLLRGFTLDGEIFTWLEKQPGEVHLTNAGVISIVDPE